MFEVAGGVVLVAVGVALMTHFRARNGKVHWLIKLPGMETTIAIGIVCLISVGLAMTASGFLR